MQYPLLSYGGIGSLEDSLEQLINVLRKLCNIFAEHMYRKRHTKKSVKEIADMFAEQTHFKGVFPTSISTLWQHIS